MSDVREWLEGLGLGEYVDVFERERVTLDDLPELSDEELKELGLPLGPRKTILRVARVSHGDRGLPTPASEEQSTSNPVAIESQAERRQLTVMFCDMVGFTKLASRVDPEDLQKIIRLYEDTCAAAITRYDGYVFQRLGDGIVAFFGYPLAHEGEAERAIRAGLDIIDAFAGLDVPEVDRLQVRIGIASGMVVVSSVEKGAVGETMNLASRLQGIAQVNTIVVSERVQLLAGGAFEYEDLGKQALKGIAQPTHAYAIAGVSQAASRFEAARGEGELTPLVGRELELGLLMDRWALAQDGEGQVVLLSGEPGIGKSRILSALRERLQDEGAKAMRFQCSPYYANSAFWPSIDNFERALKFARDESPRSKLDKLESLIVGHYQRPLADVRFIASMLSIPCDERYGEITMTPQKFKDETLRTLVDLTEAAARKQPSVMLFEDLHWADPTTLEVLDLMIDRVKNVPLLIVLTHRPEFQNRWADHGHVSALNLSKLTRAQSSAMVAKIAKGKALPPDLLEQILVKTDGVPLFVEELTKSILESAELTETGDRYEYAGKSHSVTIPATLRDSLMARLDRFMPVKEIAQIGAAIGREFSYELVSAVAPLQKTQLDDALSKLTDSGLAFRRGTPPDATYIFKHALVQDAAYDSLLKSKRKELHGKIAIVIEERFRETTENEPEVLAHHLTAAGETEAAIPLWQKAGERALERTALREALSHLESALALITQLPKSDSRDRIELDVRLTLGSAYFAFHGWVAIEVKEVLEPARELARRLRDYQKLLPVTYFIWFHHGMRAEYAEAVAAAEEIQRVGAKTNDTKARVTGSMTRACAHVWKGEFEQARTMGDDVLAVYDFEEHRELAQIYNHDVKCLTLVWAGTWHWILGYPEKARAACIEQLEHAKNVGHPFNLLWGLSGGAMGLLLRRETDLLVDWLKELRVIGLDLGMPIAELLWSLWGGYALIEQRRYREGYELLSPGAEHWRQTGGLHIIPYSNMMRAQALSQLEDPRGARALVDDAIAVIDSTGHRMHEAEVYRTRGEITLLGGLKASVKEAERDFVHSLRIATDQRARGWELRTSTSLARLWQSQGKQKAAHDLLAPVYDWFTEGFDTRDLKEAKALIEELES